MELAGKADAIDAKPGMDDALRVSVQSGRPVQTRDCSDDDDTDLGTSLCEGAGAFVQAAQENQPVR